MVKLKNDGRTLFHTAVILLSVLFLCAALCSSLMGMSSIKVMRSESADRLGERLHEFILPVIVPDYQISMSRVTIHAKNNLLQPGSKWLTALLFVSILLYGCAVTWFYRIHRPIRTAVAYSSEISLRIGGHAPPVLRY